MVEDILSLVINALICYSLILAALSYTYFISSNLPKGFYRLISLIPVFYLFIILPLHLSSVFATAFATIFITWLANSKLLLFAFDHGPILPTKSLLHFLIISSLPVKLIRSSTSKTPMKKKSSFIFLLFWMEIFVFPLVITFLYTFREKINYNCKIIIYFVIVFLVMDSIIFVINFVIWTVVGVKLDPPSEDPYLATSLQDFWGRRWNLMVTNILRYTVYKPVMKVVFSGKDWAVIPAIIVTFLVSGFMHESLVYYMTRVNPTWEMTSFFVLHGICILVEVMVKRGFAGKFELPVVVARVLTVGFVVATSFWLYFPPLIKSGADVKVLDEFEFLVEFGMAVIKIVMESMAMG